VPLNRTPPGAFLRLVLDLAESALAPVPLLAALKHPLAAGGLAPEIFRERARRLETAIRGPRPAPGFAGLRAALDHAKPLRSFVDKLETCLGALADLLSRDRRTPRRAGDGACRGGRALAATDAESGVARLWRDGAGEAAARFCHELIDARRRFPGAAGAALSGAVRGARRRHGGAPGLWPPSAAGDLGPRRSAAAAGRSLVLGGLNEGTWPDRPRPTRGCRGRCARNSALPMPERSIGIAAHDFAQAIGAPEVALTRAPRREGVPTVPSRWLLRLDAVLRAAGWRRARARPEIASRRGLRDEPAERAPSRPPRLPAAGAGRAAVGDAGRDLDPRSLRDLCPHMS
jgi:ATP-dependent helicase/nuclease subunit B